MTILDEIAAYARERVAQAQLQVPLSELKSRLAHEAIACAALQGFKQALAQQRAQGNVAFICECKKASPSKGLIEPNFDYLEIAQTYEAAGADAISVLTEPKWFLGADAYLQRIAAQVRCPCLRKDFVVDAYQIYEAKLLGAKAVLLIVALLDDSRLQEFLQLAHELGLDALVEAHDEAEIERALQAGATIIGVNNRNLHNFSVDSGNSTRLRGLVPAEVLFVAESGIASPEQVTALTAAGCNALLIGEYLMRAPDKAALLRTLRAAAQQGAATQGAAAQQGAAS